MARVKRSLNAKKKRRATLELTKGFRGEAHSNYKRAKEALMKADSYAYRDRRNRKRDFRRLWITRINAAARQNGMSYGQFMHGLKLAGIELDRKVLADIAVRDAETFRRFAEAAREAVAAASLGRTHHRSPRAPLLTRTGAFFVPRCPSRAPTTKRSRRSVSSPAASGGTSSRASSRRARTWWPPPMRRAGPPSRGSWPPAAASR